MASRVTNVVELVYLLRDLASLGIQKIKNALQEVKPAASEAAAENDRLQESFDETAEKSNRLADALRKTRNSIAAYAAAFFGLNALRKGFLDILDAGAGLETLEIQIKQLYDTAEEGERAFAWVRQFAKDNPAFDVTQAFVRLKAFGIDPTTGSLQALIDQSAKLGGNQQTLEGLILAVGQAWSKQKLQGEEILQLVERGVPVWDLLAEATGKNVVELQKLSEQGKLGRAEIALLLAEIGKSSEGAAKAQLGTFTGLIATIQTQYRRFLEIIANSGVLNTVKQQLEEFNNSIEQLAKSGQLDRIARGIGTVITGIINFVRSLGGTGVVLLQVVAVLKLTTLAFGGLFKAIGLVLQVGLVLRIAGWVRALKEYTVVAGAANVATSGIGSAFGLLGGGIGRVAGMIFSLSNLLKGTLVVGAVAAVVEIGKLAKALYDAAAAAINLSDTAKEIEESNALLADRAAEAKERLAEYADQAILTGRQLDELSEKDIQGYKDRLKAAQDYFLAVRIEARALGDEPGVAAATEKINAYEQALQGVSERLKQIQTEAAAAAAAQAQAIADLDASLRELGISLREVETGISDSEQRIIDALTDITQSTELTGDVIAKAFAEAFQKVESPEALEKLKELLDKITDDAIKVKGETAGLKQAEAAYIEVLIKRGRVLTNIGAAQSKVNAAAVKQIGDIQAKFDGSVESVKNVTQAIGESKDKIDETADSQSKVTQETEKTGDVIRSSADLVKLMADAYQGAKQRVSELSAEAEQMFEATLAGSLVWYRTGAAVQEGFTDPAQAELANLRETLRGLQNEAFTLRPQGVTEYINAVRQAEVETRIAFLEQRTEVDRLTESLERLAEGGSGSLAEVNRAAILADTSFQLLGEENLQGLRSAIEDARNRINSLRDDAEQTLTRLQERLFQLQGNEAELQKLRFQQEQLDLQNKLNVARKTGDQEAIAALEESLNLLRQVNQEELKRIENRDKAQRRERERDTEPETRRPIGGNLPDNVQPISRNILPVIQPDKETERLNKLKEVEIEKRMRLLDERERDLNRRQTDLGKGATAALAEELAQQIDRKQRLRA